LNEGTLTLGTFFGIPLKLHWSFALLLIYVGYDVVTENSFVFLWKVLFLFLCVVLHEYGHALMAKKYKITTRDIILSPIGGVARLEQLPEKPKQELAIAFAGPFVNFVICILIGLVIFLFKNSANLLPSDLSTISTTTDYLRLGFLTNLTLFLFNLIPAFPMDGGRVLRALLAINMGRAKATKIASIVGRVIAACFIIYGLSNGDYLFAMLGVFVFSMAGAESRDVDTTEKLSLGNVEDFMKTDFTKLHIGDQMSKPIDLLKRTGESNFLVYDSLGYVVGTMPSHFIVQAIKKNAYQDQTTQWLSNKIFSTKPTTSLKDVYEIMNKNGASILIVKNDVDETVGVIDRDAVTRAIEIL
jgi:Zn-dependent protease/predicted transcriptional regulator